MTKPKYPVKSRPIRTVAGLIKHLQKLPPRMPVHSGFSDAVEVKVYNYSESVKELGLTLHCEIEEAGY